MERNQPPKKSRESIKAESIRKERRHARDLNARAHLASGAVGRSGDSSTSMFLFDSKTTSGESIRITGQDVARLCTQARQQSREPALVIELNTKVLTTPNTWVAIPMEVFNRLFNQ